MIYLEGFDEHGELYFGMAYRNVEILESMSLLDLGIDVTEVCGAHTTVRIPRHGRLEIYSE